MYSYEGQKNAILSDGGQRAFLKVRDRVFALLKESRAFRMDAIFDTGDSWFFMACADRMVELGEIRECVYDNDIVGQHRVFMNAWEC